MIEEAIVLEKPLVGVIHGYNQMSSENVHIRPIVEAAKLTKEAREMLMKL